MSERVVRAMNDSSDAFAVPLVSDSLSEQRGLISETAIQMYARTLSTGVKVADLPTQLVQESAALASQHLSQMRRWSRQETSAISDAEIEEAMLIAGRIHNFVESLSLTDVLAFPEFLGCGWLSKCVGDLWADRILFEMKAGSRAFRSIDVRQILCYCALNIASPRFDISHVCLFNPREGTFCTISLDHLCTLAAGRSAFEILSDIVEYASEPIQRY